MNLVYLMKPKTFAKYIGHVFDRLLSKSNIVLKKTSACNINKNELDYKNHVLTLWVI